MNLITTTYTVTGMTCGHCATSVREEISEIGSVTAVEVDVAAGAVTVTATQPVSTEQVRTAVEEAGYQLTGGPA